MESTDYRSGRRSGRAAAIASLLAGATVWGLIWYPYRVVEAGGLSGALATTLTYAVALALGLPFLWPRLRGARPNGWLVAIALASAGCNLGYVLAMLHGEVMRVLLLFYLAPLWTLFLARLLLNERVNAVGAGVMALSLAGAATMLWHPGLGLPWPGNGAEWMGLGAGFLFALSNVLIRRTPQLSIEIKSVAVFFGMVVVGMAAVLLEPSGGGKGVEDPSIWAMVVLIGVTLLVINLVVQYGLTRVAANQAIVIFLFELVVAALSSWFLAGEAMGPREWIGGALIVAAGFFSGRLRQD
ncbi:MAG: DMT family transporter [Candidatus Nitricoxidivorans perseverans]|uniref:DMT family transporter n=1 Tax=Candidatus Nitricoxidivorans perseverans TaxID=2975601 RepID=A0AA49FMX7_9PROT|nr:MAG: DMT family transporter [Candidatus Nitricoxidivorans perseverans]